MKKIWIVIIVLVVFAIVGAYSAYLAIRKTVAGPTATPTQLFSTDNVRVSYPPLYGTISSPVSISGEAKGPWYFEAVFPITITDANGKELGKGQAQATSDWMTTDWVPFTAMITFKKPTTSIGRIIFHKDNPSGLPENDREEIMIVKFQ